MFKIEKGIPINGKGKRSHWDLPLAKMDVGDSFLIPFQSGVEREAFRKRISVVLCSRAKNYRGRFTSRTLKDGVRVWKVA